MLNTKKKAAKIAVALTWDGARYSTASLPAKAKTWLRARGYVLPTRRAAAALLADNAVTEMRICWVPRLKGGDNVLADPFAAQDGRRVTFRAAKTVRFGEALGVIYRRV